MSILVFPAGLPRALDFITTHPDAVGVSSVENDPARVHYKHWADVPYITEPDFPEKIAECITEHGVTLIYCPHNIAWGLLKDIVKDIDGVDVLEPSPIGVEQQPYRQALEAASQLDSPLSQLELAGILKTAWRIEGEMVDSKIAALTKIFPLLPKGDIVEIGALYGKSAYVMSWLSRRYDIGNILCLDPWDLMARSAEDADIVASTVSQRDYGLIHQGFMMNLSAAGNVNFVRAFAENAVPDYQKGTVISELGETSYTGKISLLHIDGNHDYEFVVRDYEKWSPMVQPGGWIIFDDYEWRFGDGPKRAGDEFARRMKPATTFVDGGALFVQLPA